MIKNERLIKNDLIYRASLRGLKKCTSCGYITGQRALICRNVNCELRIKRLAAIKPFDPIQLVTNGCIKLFSLRSKEKLLQPRNFVSITEGQQDSINSHPCAVCYVDNCKYNCTEPAHLVCRHIKACKVLTNVALAEIYPIDSSILWNLNIPGEQKQQLWKLYSKEEKLIQPVQKLNTTTFVVKCEESNIFPAGRLHVTVSNNKTPSKNGNFSCSCKKLKIMMEPDNSVVMKPDVCDHVLLLLVAVLNKPEGKKLYAKFLDLLQHWWMPTTLNMPIVDCGIKSSEFLNSELRPLETSLKSSINDKKSVMLPEDSNDIFNFTEDLFAENNMPDLFDIILDCNNDEITNVQKLNNSDHIKLEAYKKDPKLTTLASNLKDEEMDLSFQPFHSPLSLACLGDGTSQTPPHLNDNNLSAIEQFQLNHNLHISNDNIELAKDIENLNSMECNLNEDNTEISGCITKQKSVLKSYSTCNSKIEETTPEPSISINSLKSPTLLQSQKSIVLKQGNVKIIKIGTPLKKLPIQQSSKIVQIMKISPRKLMVLNSQQKDEASHQTTKQLPPCPNHSEDKQINLNIAPTLPYESWLDYVIEILNTSIYIRDSTAIKNTFHVPETFFNYFSRTFMADNAKKLPNKTIVKYEKCKSHTKYSWSFNQASTVQQLFITKNTKIELERLFKRLPNNEYELFTPTKIKLNNNLSFRTIYPKIQLYKVFVKFNNIPDLCSEKLRPDKSSFRLEWLPTALPKSNFGLMTIEFCVSVKELDAII